MNNKLKDALRPSYQAAMMVLNLVGVNVGQLAHLRYFPRFLRDCVAFRKQGGEITRFRPILVDYSATAGSSSGHYFHQDLLVAKLVYSAMPKRHVDVGSRIDGFVAHVASFRNIEVIDIRPLPPFAHPQISFIQGDLMRLNHDLHGICDSLSCLHALEHFGLGRYGDIVDTQGHLKGFDNLYRMLVSRGVLYLSCPVGQSEVHFNSQRVFDPMEIVSWCEGRFELVSFSFVDDAGDLHRDAFPKDAQALRNGCGIFVLRKY